MVKLETLVNEIKDKNLKDSSFQLYYYNGLETCNCIKHASRKSVWANPYLVFFGFQKIFFLCPLRAYVIAHSMTGIMGIWSL